MSARVGKPDLIPAHESIMPCSQQLTYCYRQSEGQHHSSMWSKTTGLRNCGGDFHHLPDVLHVALAWCCQVWMDSHSLPPAWLSVSALGGRLWSQPKTPQAVEDAICLYMTVTTIRAVTPITLLHQHPHPYTHIVIIITTATASSIPTSISTISSTTVSAPAAGVFLLRL